MHEIELCGIVTVSPIMARLLEELWLFAPLTEPVLIQGETGTGKSLVARGAHVECPTRRTIRHHRVWRPAGKPDRVGALRT